LLASAASLPPEPGLSAEDAEADRRARRWFRQLADEGEAAAGVVTAERTVGDRDVDRMR
jgi:hypothetical protein